ncbi:MAG: hypothetical protein A3J28_17200 [Acidobacteria bacterium RIFCSPLOWO2_12_FULL_60_22]|nr:MAG: hypothetical protein A3J28_17200 [Acidobacteria bacterium RIFCSPLOWO2_12_FULL_60_22]
MLSEAKHLLLFEYVGDKQILRFAQNDNLCVYTIRRNALGPGLTSSDSTSVTIPAGTTVGTYYIIGKADADNVVVETQETNNTRSATVKVTAP